MNKMKNLHIRFRKIVLITLLFGSFIAQGQDYRVSRIEHKSFKVGANAELKITNKYGRIELIPWEKDSIKFEVTVAVRAKKEAKAMSILNDINIEFTSFKYFIESKTSFTSQESFWGGMKDKTNSMFSSDNKTQINYLVYIPDNIHLTIKNKYGDVFMEDHTGTVTISLSNGDLRARNLLGPTSIKLEFAYANIKQLDHGSIRMDHNSELVLNLAGDLKIESRSSRVSISEIKKLDMNSHRDKYKLDKVEALEANNSYTYLDIGSLGELITAKAKYGGITIETLESEVKKLNFDVEDTDIELKKPEGRSITIEAIYSEKAGLYFPAKLINKQTSLEDEEKKLVKTTGMLGDNFVSPIKLTIIIPTGNLSIR